MACCSTTGLQFGTLTRLRELRIHESYFESDGYAPLAQLSGTLTRLDMHEPFSLPDCTAWASSQHCERWHSQALQMRMQKPQVAS